MGSKFWRSTRTSANEAKSSSRAPRNERRLRRCLAGGVGVVGGAAVLTLQRTRAEQELTQRMAVVEHDHRRTARSEDSMNLAHRPRHVAGVVQAPDGHDVPEARIGVGDVQRRALDDAVLDAWAAEHRSRSRTISTGPAAMSSPWYSNPAWPTAGTPCRSRGRSPTGPRRAPWADAAGAGGTGRGPCRPRRSGAGSRASGR